MIREHLRLFSPFGRIDRRTYAMAMSGLVVSGLVLDGTKQLGPLPLILLPLTLCLSWLSFTVLTKRLHDFGMDVLGIYLGAFAVTLLVMLTGMFASRLLGAQALPVALALGLLLRFGWLAFLVWVGFQKGNPRRNQHGSGGSAQPPGSEPTGYLTL